MKKEVVRRYSQAFKQQVVREYEAGTSVNSLMQKYGIGGHRTVPRWIKKYSLEGIRSEVMIIQSAEDQLEFKLFDLERESLLFLAHRRESLRFLSGSVLSL